MYSLIDIELWNRKEHFHFFKQFSQPFFGITVEVDCTKLFLDSRHNNLPFFHCYLHVIASSINEVENLKYRIVGDELRCYDKINISSTVLRADKSFGFSFIEFDNNLHQFSINLENEMARVKATKGLFTSHETERVDAIHFSVLPWINFSAVDHAYNIGSGDSCPKVSVGKLKIDGEKFSLPISLHAHHACADGYHAGLFFESLQNKMNG